MSVWYLKSKVHLEITDKCSGCSPSPVHNDFSITWAGGMPGPVDPVDSFLLDSHHSVMVALCCPAPLAPKLLQDFHAPTALERRSLIRSRCEGGVLMIKSWWFYVRTEGETQRSPGEFACKIRPLDLHLQNPQPKSPLSWIRRLPQVFLLW